MSRVCSPHSPTKSAHVYVVNLTPTIILSISSLRNHAVALGFFGGELLIDKLNFLEKFVVRRLMHETESVFHLDEQEVDSFITKMNL